MAARKKVAFSKFYHEDDICFDFCGLNIHFVSEVFNRLSHLYKRCLIAAESQQRIIHGKHYKSVIASIVRPRFDILSEDEWTIMIIHLLRNLTPCEVTFYPEYEQFLNDT